MTPYEFDCALKGYEQKEKLSWEKVRWQTFYLMSVEGRGVAKKFKYTDLKLPHEVEIKPKPKLTKEQEAKILEMFDKPVKKVEEVKNI